MQPFACKLKAKNISRPDDTSTTMILTRRGLAFAPTPLQTKKSRRDKEQRLKGAIALVGLIIRILPNQCQLQYAFFGIILILQLSFLPEDI